MERGVEPWALHRLFGPEFTVNHLSIQRAGPLKTELCDKLEPFRASDLALIDLGSAVLIPHPW